MRTRWTKIGVQYAGDPLITAQCPDCGHKFAAVTADRDATIDHRCPTDTLGPAWTLVCSQGGRQIPRGLTWAQHIALQGAGR